MYSEGKFNTDQSLSKVEAEHPCTRDVLAQQLFKTENSLRPGWARLAGHGCLALISVLEYVTRAGGA